MNISYAAAARSVKVNNTIHSDKTPTTIAFKQQKQTTTCPEKVQNATLTQQKDELNNQSAPSPIPMQEINLTSNGTVITTCEATTQTEQTIGCQTETHQYIQTNEALVKLLTGTLHIWDTAKTKKNREQGIVILIEQIFHQHIDMQQKDDQQRLNHTSTSSQNGGTGTKQKQVKQLQYKSNTKQQNTEIPSIDSDNSDTSISNTINITQKPLNKTSKNKSN